MSGTVTIVPGDSEASSVLVVGGGQGDSTVVPTVESPASLVSTPRAARTFYAGPTAGAAPATFREIEPADLPFIPAGADGQSFTLGATVDSYADLPVPEASNTGHVVRADGLLYVFDGEQYPADGEGAPFVGPAGPMASWDTLTGKPAFGTAALLDVGIANGVPPLGADAKLATSWLPPAVLGQVSYQGFWDASTGAPPTAAPQKGWYYIVTVDGDTALDGVTGWRLGDWAIHNGVAWGKVDNTDSVNSVAGLVGAISAASLRAALALAAVAMSGDYNDLTNKPGTPPLPVRTINAQSGTTYTTVLGDGNSGTTPGTIIQASNAGAITITIPANAGVAYPIGSELYITQTGAGQITLAAASGVTLNGKVKTRVQWSTLGLYQSATNVWTTFGDGA